MLTVSGAKNQSFCLLISLQIKVLGVSVSGQSALWLIWMVTGQITRSNQQLPPARCGPARLATAAYS
jgi:hypothetical protein